MHYGPVSCVAYRGWAEPSRRVATAPGSGAGRAPWPKTASRSLRWSKPRPPRGPVPGAIERICRKPLLAGLVPGPAPRGPARQGIRRHWMAAAQYLLRAAIKVGLGAESMVWDPCAPLPPGPPMPRWAPPLFAAQPRLGPGYALTSGNGQPVVEGPA